MRRVLAERRAASDLYSDGGLWRRYRIARARAVARAAAGTLLLLTAVTGLPVALLLLQRPIFDGFDLAGVVAQPMSAGLLAVLGVAGGWLLWLWLVTATVLDVARAVRRLGAPMLLPAPLHAAVASMAGIVVTATGPSAAHAAVAPAAAVHTPAVASGATTAAPPAVAGPSPTTWSHPTTTDPADAVHAAAPTLGSPQVSYLVRRGDWLGAISDRYLGTFDRYPELQRLNPGLIPDTAGRRGPDHIEAGWRLVLPTDARDRGTRRHATGTTTSTGTDATAPSGNTPAGPATSPPGTATTAPPGASHAAGASPTPGSKQPGPADRRQGEGVALPGGWITLPLAAALAGAAAMVWLRRRHRYGATSRTTSDHPDDPHLRPLPPVMNRIRRAVRQQRPDLLNPPTSPQPTVAEYTAASADQRPPLPPIGPNGPHLAGVGDRVPPGGLGLVGAGAEPAARALLVAALASGTPADPDAKGQIIAPADTLTTLLGADADHTRQIPRLHVTRNLSEALTRADELLIERRRLLEEYDAADLTELRAADPYHPPMPPVLLLAETPPSQLQARLSTTLHLGAPLQISAVLLGEWPPGDTLTVDIDGHTTGRDNDRLAVLDIPTTRNLLEVLREAHTGQPSPASPPAPTASGIDLTPPAPASADPESPDSQPQAAPSAATTAPAPPETRRHSASPDVPAAAQHAADTADIRPTPDRAPIPAPAAPTRPPATATPRRAVHIRLLGEPTILDRDGCPVSGLRHHARELLVYLAVHRSGADLSDIMEAFWPAATVRRAGERLSTEVGNLRRQIRHAAADTTIQPVINTGGRYHLDPNLVDLDVWQLTDALRQASTTTEPTSRAALLRQAIDVHTGPLAQGHDYDWIEQPREQLRRHGIRARLSLAEVITADDPRGAADLIHAAAALDPINEDLARHAMRAFARLGDAPAVHGVLQHLSAALDDIDEQPSPDTIALAAQLQRDLTTGDRPANETGHQDPNP
ncbi:BTAD domain-containing putative transcriptional regulator [Dactylosporangium sp. CA-139066]|uniref:BTAD domain-containing putative transcriptional regulator n=1 Tax=Dactylosporangium sp. CA-139066 TaxID=3239930 RepID=UPI003D92C7CD